MDKSIFNFKIQYKDGKIIDLHDENLWVSSFRIMSPTPDHKTETVEGRHGSIYLGSTLKERKIKATIMIESVDYTDFDLMRDYLFRIFNPLNKFYIIRDLQKGKRMEVSVDSDFDIDYLSLEDGEFDIDFVIHSTFLESIGTTLDSKTFDAEVWQVGQGLIADETQYTHTTKTFRIYNAGDVTINPREHPLLIEFKGVSIGLTIKNKTTGDEWKYTESTAPLDVIRLEGVRSFKNNVSIFSDTNRKLLTIQPGWNDFEITGPIGFDGFEISFDFRFYYL